MSMPGSTVPVTMTMNTATTTVMIEPSNWSKRPHGMSFSSIPLSTTALCWKNSIQGAIVVPMLAMRKKNSSPLNPPAQYVSNGGVHDESSRDVNQVQCAE